MAEKDDRRPERLYANHLEVGHNAFEFLLDFGMLDPGTGAIRFQSGIVTSPGYAHVFLETLQQAIRGYELTYGPIREKAREEQE